MPFSKKLASVISGLLVAIAICVSFAFTALPVWADDANQLIVVAGTVKVKPEKEQEFIDFSKTLITPSRSEAGAISYSFYKDETKDHTFIFYEEWKSQAALDYHFQTSYFKEFVEKAPDLLAEPPVIKVFNIESFKTL